MSLLSVRDVVVSFGGLAALRGASLEVERGTIVGVIGPNGAGKTTLFNVITGLQRAAGTVEFEGRDISVLAPHRRAQLGIGRTFQNLGLMLDETATMNLLAAQHVSTGYRAWDLVVRPWVWRRREALLRRRANEVLRELNLVEFADKRVGDLSFGVARFIELAAVLVQRPTLMMLDEPTTGLDVGETQQLAMLLTEARRTGVTIVLVAHDVRFVMDLCDDVYVLAEGEVLRRGSPKEVQRDPSVIAVYLGRVA